MQQFAAFLGISVLLIILPGPDMALVMRNALMVGRRGGVMTGVGVTIGLTIWTLATSAGLATLLLASGPAFTALKLAGAAYLVYLGAQALYEAIRGDQRAKPAADRRAVRRLTAPAALRQGVISNLGNPKIAVFFTSLLPPKALPALFWSRSACAWRQRGSNPRPHDGVELWHEGEMNDDLVAASLGASMVLDTELSILVVSEPAIELLGFARDELLGRSAGALVAFGPAWVERELSVFMQQGSWHGDVALRAKAGGIVNVVADAKLVPRPDGDRIFVNLQRN